MSLTFDYVNGFNTVRYTRDGMFYAVDLVRVITGMNLKCACTALRWSIIHKLRGHTIEYEMRQREGYCGPRVKLVTPKYAILMAKYMGRFADKALRVKIIDMLTKFEARFASLAERIKAADKILALSNWIEVDDATSVVTDTASPNHVDTLGEAGPKHLVDASTQTYLVDASTQT